MTEGCGEGLDATGLCTAVVCEDDPVLAAAVKGVLAACGLRVVARVDRGSDLLGAVRHNDPAVVVVDVALLGARGVGLLARVRAQTAARLVALCPPGLELPGLTQDADAVVPGDDLGPLRRALAGPASTGGGRYAGNGGMQRQGEHERGAGVDEVSAVSPGHPAGDG